MSNFYKRISPIMTSNTAPAPYVVTCSSTWSTDFDGWKVFNGTTINIYDGWATANGVITGWLKIDLGTPNTVNCYVLTNRNYSGNGTTAAPKDWTIEGSNDNINWDILDTQNNITWTTYPQAKSFLLNNSTPYRYYLINITANNGYTGYTAIGEWELRYDLGVNTPKYYYVSQQRGKDTNNGLSPETPWGTLTKAVQAVQATTQGDTYIHVGPGVYREALTLSYGGTAADHRIIFKGDPECLDVIGDKPGNVRLTCATSQEALQTNVRPIAFNTKTYIEFWNFDIDGSSSNAAPVYSGGSAVYAGEIIRNCRLNNRYGPYYVTCYNCVSIAAANNFYGCICYNCIGIGGNMVFSGTNYNCLAIGGTNSFNGGTNTNCISIGSGGAGFVNGTNTACYNIFSNTASAAAGVTNASTTNPIALLDMDFDWLLPKGIQDIGDNSVTDLPSTDINGAPRIMNNIIDVGPWEASNVSMEYTDIFNKGPAIKIQGQGQVILDAIPNNGTINLSVYVKNIKQPIYSNVVPIMTSNTTPSGIVTCSSIYNTSYDGWRAFDGTIDTNPSSCYAWATASGITTGWLAYEFPTPKTIYKYSLASQYGYPNRAPKNWTFEGWNGNQWVVLDTQINQTGWTNLVYKEYAIPLNKVGIYIKYRINVTANNGDTQFLDIGEFKMFGGDPIDHSIVLPEVILHGEGLNDVIVTGPSTTDEWQLVNVSQIVPGNQNRAVQLILRSNTPNQGYCVLFSDPS